ncbi:MAG: peroxide stress protein YaaA [Acidobacteriota bacterium]
MFTVMSPAKTMVEKSTRIKSGLTTPALMTEAMVLMDLLRALSIDDIRSLMHVSDSLAEATHQRFQAFETPLTALNARPAMLTYSGDAFRALHAGSLEPEALDWAQTRIGILSGLFGLLRPLDLMQPYRLEMAARLNNPAGANLYRYWGRQITGRINEILKDSRDRVLINLASAEYSKAVRSDVLSAKMVTPAFFEYKGGREIKVHSTAAKRARGLMVRFIIENRLESADALKGFDLEGYAFVPDQSSGDTWVFSKK